MDQSRGKESGTRWHLQIRFLLVRVKDFSFLTEVSIFWLRQVTIHWTIVPQGKRSRLSDNKWMTKIRWTFFNNILMLLVVAPFHVWPDSKSLAFHFSRRLSRHSAIGPKSIGVDRNRPAMTSRYTMGLLYGVLHLPSNSRSFSSMQQSRPTTVCSNLM